MGGNSFPGLLRLYFSSLKQGVARLESDFLLERKKRFGSWERNF